MTTWGTHEGSLRQLLGTRGLRYDIICAIIIIVMLKIRHIKDAAKDVSSTSLLPPAPTEVAGTTHGSPVSVPATSESMPTPGGEGFGKAGQLLPIDYAKFHDIARRLILQQSTAEIAIDYGMSDRQIRRWLKRPEFLRIYRQVHDEMMADLDKLIKDEKVAPLLRARAQAVRMQTVLQEIVDEVQGRIKDGRARATEMKVAADVAFGLIDRAKIDLSNVPGSQGGATAVNVSLTLTGDGKRLFHETIAESGLDLSDIIDVDHTDEDRDGPPTQDA